MCCYLEMRGHFADCSEQPLRSIATPLLLLLCFARLVLILAPDPLRLCTPSCRALHLVRLLNWLQLNSEWQSPVIGMPIWLEATVLTTCMYLIKYFLHGPAQRPLMQLCICHGEEMLQRRTGDQHLQQCAETAGQ